MRWAVAVGLLVLCAGGLWAKESEEILSDHRAVFPAGVRTGPRFCTQLDSVAPDGAGPLWCNDCIDPSDPAQCGGTGAYCYRQAGRWFCGGNSILVGPCAVLGDPCTSSGDCCFGFCDPSGICVLPACIPNGGVCINDIDCCSASCDIGNTNLCFAATSTTSTSTSTTTTLPPVCSCVAPGQPCTFSGECCQGFCSVDGVCTVSTTGGCLKAGAACGGDGDCCTGMCAQGFCATQTCDRLDPALPDDTLYEWWTSPAAGTTLLDAMCYCQGTCGSSIDIRFFNRANNPIAIAGPFPPVLVCTSSSADSPFIPFDNTDVNRILTLGEGVRVSMDSLSTGVDRIRWCVRHAP